MPGLRHAAQYLLHAQLLAQLGDEALAGHALCLHHRLVEAAIGVSKRGELRVLDEDAAQPLVIDCQIFLVGRGQQQTAR